MASAPHSVISRLGTYGATLVLFALGCPGARAPLCTPVPDLYADWARASGATDTSASAVRAVVEARRAQVERLPDVFTRLWTKDSAELADEGELIAWRDDSVMVVVASASISELLVVPRKTGPFLSDMSSELRRRLATVAAASSDALALAAGRRCEDAARTEIRVNAPDGLRVRQLHVHVQPRPPVRVADRKAFYARLEAALRNQLGTSSGIR